MNNDRFKFRVWDKFHNNFIFFDLTQGIALTETEINKSEQCTGLSDKNGKLIYEHDRIKDKKGRVGTIEWNSDYSTYFIEYGNDKFDNLTRAGIIINEIEIIKNIHEVKE